MDADTECCLAGVQYFYQLCNNPDKVMSCKLSVFVDLTFAINDLVIDSYGYDSGHIMLYDVIDMFIESAKQFEALP